MSEAKLALHECFLGKALNKRFDLVPIHAFERCDFFQELDDSCPLSGSQCAQGPAVLEPREGQLLAHDADYSQAVRDRKPTQRQTSAPLRQRMRWGVEGAAQSGQRLE